MNHRMFQLQRSALVAVALLGVTGATLAQGHVAAVTTVAAPASQDAATALATGLRALNDFASASAAALATGDASAARDAYARFDSGWQAIEDGVRALSRDDYRSIEDAMREVDRALRADPVDTAAVTEWLGELQNRVNTFVAMLPGS